MSNSILEATLTAIFDGNQKPINHGYSIPFTVNGYRIETWPVAGAFTVVLGNNLQRQFDYSIYRLYRGQKGPYMFHWRLAFSDTAPTSVKKDYAYWTTKWGISISPDWAMRRIIGNTAKMLGWTFSAVKKLISEQEALQALARLGDQNGNSYSGHGKPGPSSNGVYGTQGPQGAPGGTSGPSISKARGRRGRKSH